MGDYDNKLGEWFKLVEQQEQELKAKKDVETAEAVEEPEPVAKEDPRPETAEAEGSVKEVPASVIATIDSKEVISDTALVDQSKPEPDTETAVDKKHDAGASLFDEKDVPQVEDFFSFLDRTREGERRLTQSEPPPEAPENQGAVDVVEGTGEPRPISLTASPDLDTTVERESEIRLPPSRRREESAAPVQPEVPRPLEPPASGRRAPRRKGRTHKRSGTVCRIIFRHYSPAPVRK